MVVRVRSEVPLSRREIRRIRNIARGILAKLENCQKSELSILVVGEEEMVDLNRRYLGVDGPTDVLAFPQEEPHVHSCQWLDSTRDSLLGDVVVCFPFAVKQAEERGESTEDEMKALIAHGVLHLLGYEDSSRKGREEMAVAEKQLLGRSIIEM